MTSDAQHTHEYQDHAVNRFYYQVGSHSLLLEQGLQAEVLLDTQPAQLPYSPPWCLGLVALRGALLPLVNLHYVLYGRNNHTPPPTVKKIKLWLQPKQHTAIIIECDSYPKAISLNNAQYTTKTDQTLPSWISGTITHDEQSFLIADHTILIRNLLHALQSR